MKKLEITSYIGWLNGNYDLNALDVRTNVAAKRRIFVLTEGSIMEITWCIMASDAFALRKIIVFANFTQKEGGTSFGE